jgi:hypothetical protein
MSLPIADPVPAPVGALLREAVRDHAWRERRRVYPPALHVGVPGGSTATFAPADDGDLDAALRVDVVEAMIRRLRRPPGPPLVWLSRPGPLETQDVDLRWSAATAAAAGELGTQLRMVVVDRHGWRDPRSGAGRAWTRLRLPRCPPETDDG